MAFAGMNFWAIMAAAVAAWLVGAVYYTALAKPWMAAQSWDRKEDAPAASGRMSPVPFVLAFVAELVMAWVLAGIIGHLGPGQVTLRNGLISGAFVWLGFVATTLAVNNAYGRRRLSLTLIDAGHWLAVLLVQGMVIGAFGVR